MVLSKRAFDRRRFLLLLAFALSLALSLEQVHASLTPAILYLEGMEAVRHLPAAGVFP